MANLKKWCRGPITETNRIVSFLSGLSDKYDTLKTLYMSSSGTTYKDIIIGLKSYEASKVKISERGGQAFSAKEKEAKGKKKTGGKKDKQLEPCSKCGYRNHSAADCRVDLSTITCLRCEKRGHSVGICKAKVTPEVPSTSLAIDKQGSPATETSFFAENSNDSDSAFQAECMALHARRSTHDSIIVDSGAT